MRYRLYYIIKYSWIHYSATIAGSVGTSNIKGPSKLANSDK